MCFNRGDLMAKRKIVVREHGKNKLDARVVSLTLASLFGIVYLVWILVVGLFTWGMMGKGYGMMAGRNIGSGLFPGLLNAIVFGLVVGFLYALLYNYFTKKVR